MIRSFGCLGLLLALALVAGLAVSTAPGLVAMLGLYGFVIGKGAVDGMVGRPIFAKLVSLDPQPVNMSGDIGNAVVEYGDGAQAVRARVDLLPRPISSPYRIGQQVPVLVNRMDPSRAKYDMTWMHRPEHQARLAPIWKMATDTSSRSKASRP
jgi:hypothetical protein